MFPKATLKKLMKEYGDNFRVSDDAVEFMNFVLCGYLKDVMQKARRNAQMNGRKTIKEGDVKIALEDVFKFVKASELKVKA